MRMLETFDVLSLKNLKTMFVLVVTRYDVSVFECAMPLLQYITRTTKGVLLSIIVSTRILAVMF